MGDHRHLGLALALALSILGCDGGGTEEPCDDVARPCEILGGLRCTEDLSGIEVCRELEGCLAWGEHELCPAGRACVESADGDVECRCPETDACSTVGETACSGDVLRRCVEVGENCLSYVDEVDCTGSGLVCRDDLGEAACLPPCAGCERGERRCVDDVIQICARTSIRCTDWTIEDDCAARGEVCDEESSSPSCHAACVGECDVEGASACDATIVQRCEPIAGCLRWRNVEDCAIRTMACDVVGGEAVCVCAELCADGDTRCHSGAVESCAEREDGCWVWDGLFDCVALDWLCAELEPGTYGCDGGEGEDCATARAVFSLPFLLSGDDFATDFADDLRLSEPSCPGETGGAEAVLGVFLLSGETLVAVVTDGAPLTLALQEGGDCDEARPCVASAAPGETLRHAASTDGILWLLVELDPAASGPTHYEVSLSLE